MLIAAIQCCIEILPIYHSRTSSVSANFGLTYGYKQTFDLVFHGNRNLCHVNIGAEIDIPSLSKPSHTAYSTPSQALQKQIEQCVSGAKYSTATRQTES